MVHEGLAWQAKVPPAGCSLEALLPGQPWVWHTRALPSCPWEAFILTPSSRGGQAWAGQAGVVPQVCWL